MTPILFEATETNFTSNGLGRINCISCVVTEERNGVYECEFVVPMSDKHYSDIELGKFICCTHDDDGDLQPFKIYHRSAPLNGNVTFNARHLSYLLSNVIVSPFTAASVQATLAKFSTENINTNPFNFSTDKTTQADFVNSSPASIRSLMGGSEGSILDVYGGEWDYDKWNVYLKANRGTASGITIRYGKNLIDINQDIDSGSLYNSIVPFWKQEVDGVETLVTLPEHIVTPAGITNIIPVVMDFTMEFQTQPTEAELRTFTQNYLTQNEPWIPPETLKVDFAALWQTTEYKDVANLLKLRLCDTVSVYYPSLGITAQNIKVIKTVYNVLAEKYDSIELGQPQATFAQVLTENTKKDISTAQTQDRGFFDDAITAATDLLTGETGGHVVIERDANGKPTEILILDTDSLLTATNILRINLNGIGFSQDGGNTYSTAWTINGQFVADFITAGTLKAIKIEGPTSLTFWDLATGLFQNYDESTVTAEVETSSGTYTPTTYDVKHKVVINDGLLSLNANIDNSANEDELLSLGLSGEGMNYSYYGAKETGEDTSFPFARLKLEGAKVNGRYGTGPGMWENAPMVYTPTGFYTPDYIELGRADNMTDPGTGDPVSGNPNRNVLHIGGGWSSFYDSIWFQQFYKVERWIDGTSTRKNRYIDDKRRLSWEMVPWDVLTIGQWLGTGFLHNSKKDIAVTIPIGHLISSDVTKVSFEADVHRVWQNGTTLVSSDVSVAGDSYFGEVMSWGPAGIVLSIRKDDWSAWSSSGTSDSAVAIWIENLAFGFR